MNCLFCNDILIKNFSKHHSWKVYYCHYCSSGFICPESGDVAETYIFYNIEDSHYRYKYGHSSRNSSIDLIADPKLDKEDWVRPIRVIKRIMFSKKVFDPPITPTNFPDKLKTYLVMS